MPGLITNKDGNFESSLDNVTEELAWVKKQIKKELSDLQKNVQEDQVKETFFEKRENTVIYHMDLVKQYLQSCVQKDEFQINSAVVMAVQIALESKGYEVGKIDGLLKNTKGTLSMTEQAIRKFQKENGLRVDGVPGRNTVKKILEKLGNIPVEPKKPEKKEDSKGKDDLDNTKESLDLKQEEQVKLFALEIYRGRVMSDKDIEAKGYDPKEVRKRVKNKSEMERLDRIVPKNMRHEQATESLDTHKSNDETNKESIKSESEKQEKTPTEKPVEKSAEKKENNNLKESWESVDILVGPKLKATNRKEVGGIGSSIMYGFQGYGSRGFGFSNMAGKGSGRADGSRFDEENGKIYEDFILPRAELIDYCKSHKIKSFMFYFGGNESTAAQQKAALENIERWGNYLEKGGIQPVLCTCIGENIKEHKNSAGDYYVKEYNKAIREMQERHGWPLIDFVKIDEPDIFRPNDCRHPGDTGYRRMGKKIEQCFSSAEK